MAYIIVIDDDEQIRDLICDLLEDAGHQVMSASDGTMGLEMLRQGTADLVITDMFMPDKDGTEIIMDIFEEFPKTKIIAISGGGNIKNVDYLELARNLGAVKTFQKPFSLDEFKAAVEEILQ
jgi:DNA-binding NtrC family response regulator